MMLQNIDCNYIKVDSSVFTAVLEDIPSYKSIKVDIKKNCCESLVYSSEIILSDLNLKSDIRGIHSRRIRNYCVILILFQGRQ